MNCLLSSEMPVNVNALAWLNTPTGLSILGYDDFSVHHLVSTQSLQELLQNAPQMAFVKQELESVDLAYYDDKNIFLDVDGTQRSEAFVRQASFTQLMTTSLGLRRPGSGSRSCYVNTLARKQR